MFGLAEHWYWSWFSGPLARQMHSRICPLGLSSDWQGYFRSPPLPETVSDTSHEHHLSKDKAALGGVRRGRRPFGVSDPGGCGQRA